MDLTKSAGWLLCSRARPSPRGEGSHNSRNVVWPKDGKDQEREHKNTRYLYIWVTGQVRDSKAREANCLRKYTWNLNGVFFRGKKCNLEPVVCSSENTILADYIKKVAPIIFHHHVCVLCPVHLLLSNLIFW